MCLSVPGRVEETWEIGETKMGRVDFGGIHKDVCLAYVPEVGVGEYVLVHVGFALDTIDEEAARETLELLKQTGQLAEEFELATGTESETAGMPAAGATPDAAPAGSARA